MDDAHEDDTSPASDRCDLTAEVQLVQDPHVHFNVYMAGTRPLSYYEEALRTEFLALHIYLIRGVDVADIQAPPQNQADALAFGLIGCGQATWRQIERLLGMLPSDKSLRWVQDDAGSMEVRPKRFTVGAWVRGPMTGVNIHARLYPWVVRALTGIVRAWDPTHCFTAITLSMNVKASPHKDKYNEKCSSNLLLHCSSFQGGQLFVENADGTHQLQRGGVTGHIFSTQEPTIFSPCCTHATLPWQGTRLLLIAYHTSMTQHLCQEDRHALAGMGFVIGSWCI